MRQKLFHARRAFKLSPTSNVLTYSLESSKISILVFLLFLYFCYITMLYFYITFFKTKPSKINIRKKPSGVKNKRNLFLGILSDPRNVEKREKIRRDCLPVLHNQAQSRGIALTARFFMGRPSEPGFYRGLRVQGRKAGQTEVYFGKQVISESLRYADIFPVPFVEQYIDLMDKTIALFRYAVDKRYSLIVKMDDDSCLNVTGPIWERWVKRSTPKYYYFGFKLFRGTESVMMRGVDNITAPYMSGPCYGLSFHMAKLIFYNEYSRVTQHQSFASSSEDATVGRMVMDVERKYLLNINKSVTYEEEKRWKQESLWVHIGP